MGGSHGGVSDGGPGISNFEAGVNVAKAVMGAGSFGLPWAARQGGWLLSGALLAIVCVLANVTLRLLLEVKAKVRRCRLTSA